LTVVAYAATERRQAVLAARGKEWIREETSKSSHTIGTPEEWQTARDEQAKLEAEHDELGRRVTQQRR
jgi:hypothetical protein